MSIAGIASSSSLFQNSVVQQTQNRFQQIQSQFQKLGQDLQSGNLTQAKSDFATLTQELPGGTHSNGSSATSATAGASSNSNPILQAFQSLGQDLQSGNLTAAQPISRRFSRARSRRKLPARRIVVTTITIAVTPARIHRSLRSSRISHRWARISNRAVSQRLSKRTLRSNPISSSTYRASLPARRAVAPAQPQHPRAPALASPRNP